MSQNQAQQIHEQAGMVVMSVADALLAQKLVDAARRLISAWADGEKIDGPMQELEDLIDSIQPGD